MSKLLIAVSSAPTHDNDSHQTSYQDRLAWVETTVEKVHSKAKDKKYDPPQGTLRAVALLPEYYFTKKAAGREPLSTKDVDAIRIRLHAISKKYPGVLFIPGTVFYEKDAFAQKEQFKRNPATGVRDVARVDTRGTLERNLAGFKESRKLVASFTSAPTVAEVKKNTLSEIKQNTAELLTTTEMKLTQAQKGISKAPLWLCKNEAYVLFGGSIVLKHAKLDGFHETQLGGNRVFVPGSKVGMGEVGPEKTRIGVEICMENATGTLERTRKGVQVHLHLIVSAWVKPEGYDTLLDGGYMVHSSSQSAEIGVWQYKSGGWIDCTKQSFKKTIGDASVQAYEVDRW